MAMFEAEMGSWFNAEIACSYIDNMDDQDKTDIPKGVTVRMILEACKGGTGDLNAIRARMTKECDICCTMYGFNEVDSSIYFFKCI